MNQIWFVVSVFCAIFLNSLLAIAIGVNPVTTFAFAPFTLLITYDIISLKLRLNVERYKPELFVMLIGFFLIVLKFIVGQGTDFFKQILLLFVFPALISIYFEKASIFRIKILRNVLDLFFVLECLLAIYERITRSFVLYVPTEEIIHRLGYQMDWAFRSYAFYTHPLANAMVVAVIMVFVVTSNSTVSKKVIFTVLGFAALLCFNARGATLVSTVTTLPYLISLLYKNTRPKYRGILISFWLVILSSCIYTILNSDIGGRLVHANELLDGSAKTRLQVFQFYKFLNIKDLLWGNSNSYLFLTDKLGAGGVENGIVVFIIDYGLIITPVILLFLFKFQLKKLGMFPFTERWLILLVFYLIGIMNPNLAEALQWTIFVFAYYSYRNVASVKGGKFKYSTS
ncbi:hypothetical protein B0O79_2472 [Flavobacteriaceae bacterium MAR_2009_75]|nr:hypothetical protein B0O79_2472 [Flavobacteriaceae bacterium MAR_2009_75]